MKKFTTELKETIIDRLNDYKITKQIRELNINDEDLF